MATVSGISDSSTREVKAGAGSQAPHFWMRMSAAQKARRHGSSSEAEKGKQRPASSDGERSDGRSDVARIEDISWERPASDADMQSRRQRAAREEDSSAFDAPPENAVVRGEAEVGLGGEFERFLEREAARQRLLGGSSSESSRDSDEGAEEGAGGQTGPRETRGGRGGGGGRRTDGEALLAISHGDVSRTNLQPQRGRAAASDARERERHPVPGAKAAPPVLTGHVSSLPPVLTGHVSSIPPY